MGRRSKTERSAGGVVFRSDRELKILLILDRNGNWGFPKGHIDPGEAPHQTALREVAEEAGLADLELRAPLGQIDWFFRWDGNLIHKFCDFFLFESVEGEPKPQMEEGIVECRWAPPEEARGLLSHENTRVLLSRALRALETLHGPEIIGKEP